MGTKTIVFLALSATLVGSLGYILTEKVKTDFENGNLQIEKKQDSNEDGFYVNYDAYVFKDPITKFYSNYLTPKKLKSRYDFNFENSEDYLKKQVYTIKGDSKAISYTFEKGNKVHDSFQKSFKKKVYLQKPDFLKSEEVNKIYRSKASNVMQADYIVEFKAPKTAEEMYVYTESVIKTNKNVTDVTETDFILKYNLNSGFLSEATYKRLNISISFGSGKMVVRNFVANRIEKNEIRSPYSRIY